MNYFATYYKLQLKRLFRMLPTILAASVLACLTSMLILWAGVGKQDENGAVKSFRIGMVGELSDYLGIRFEDQLSSFAKIGNLDIEFLPCDEQTAKNMLLRGELSTYLIIPDGFVEAVASGANDLSLHYVTLSGNMGLSEMVMEELASEASTIFSSGESTCFAIQEILMDAGDSQWATKVNNYSISQLLILLGLVKQIDVDVIGLGANISLVGYYVCAVLTLFMLLYGFNATLFFTKREKTLFGNLYRKGVVPGKMLLAEMGAFGSIFGGIVLALILLFSAGIYIVSSLGKKGNMQDAGKSILYGIRKVVFFQEWQNRGFAGYLVFIGSVLLVLIMLTALQFMIYEIMEHFINQIISLFFITFLMGYVSGLFYPRSFFPEWLQRVGAVLPTGVALDVLCDGFVGITSGKEHIIKLLLLMGYTCLFSLISVWSRGRKVKV